MKCGDAVIDNEDGVNIILNALEEFFGEDSLMEEFIRYQNLFQKTRKVGQDIKEYMDEWEAVYEFGGEKVKTFQLLLTMRLDKWDTKRVLDRLDRKTEDEEKSLFQQAKKLLTMWYMWGALDKYKVEKETEDQHEEDKKEDQEDKKKVKRKVKWRKCFRCASECPHKDKKCGCPASKHLIANCPKVAEDRKVVQMQGQTSGQTFCLPP